MRRERTLWAMEATPESVPRVRKVNHPNGAVPHQQSWTELNPGPTGIGAFHLGRALGETWPGHPSGKGPERKQLRILPNSWPHVVFQRVPWAKFKPTSPKSTGFLLRQELCPGIGCWSLRPWQHPLPTCFEWFLLSTEG